LTAGSMKGLRSPTSGVSVASSSLWKIMMPSGRGGRGRARLVCQAKKSSGAAGTKTRKKAPSGGASLSTSVRKSLVEEVLKEERKFSGGNNIVPAGGLSRSSRQNRALVLDSAYRPINVWSWSKAVMMDVLQRCDVIEYYPPPAHALSGRGLHKLPAVVRVDKYVDVNELCQQVSCTPRNVLMRDKFCCQYCGSKQHLTLDHIVPLSKGGKNTWGNLITACMPCNQKKGDKLLSQLGWKMIGPPPREPKPHEVGFVAGLRMRDLVRPPEIWSLFLEPYRARMGGLLEHIKTSGEDDMLNDE